MKSLLHLSGHFLTNCNLSALPALRMRLGMVCFSEGGVLACTLTLGQAPELCGSLWPGMEHSGLGRAEQFTEAIILWQQRAVSQDRKKRMPEQIFPSFFAYAFASAAEAGSGSVPVDEIVSYRSRKAEWTQVRKPGSFQPCEVRQVTQLLCASDFPSTRGGVCGGLNLSSPQDQDFRIPCELFSSRH